MLSLGLYTRLHCLLPWPRGRESPFKIQFKHPKALSDQISSHSIPTLPTQGYPYLCPTVSCTNLPTWHSTTEHVFAFPQTGSSGILIIHKYLLGQALINALVIHKWIKQFVPEQLLTSQDPNQNAGKTVNRKTTAQKLGSLGGNSKIPLGKEMEVKKDNVKGLSIWRCQGQLILF